MKEPEIKAEEPMDPFERALHKALSNKVSASPEAMAKFLAIADEAQEYQRRTGKHWFTPRGGGKILVFPKPRAWMGGALAAALVIGVFTAEQVHDRRERRAMADQQFQTATQIENQALEHTRELLARKGISLDQQ
jgi:hypothetical protein